MHYHTTICTFEQGIGANLAKTISPMAGYFDNFDQVIILNSGGYSASQAFVFHKNLLSLIS